MNATDVASKLGVCEFAVDVLEMVAHAQPERECGFRASSRNCTGKTEFLYFSEVADRRINVCAACAVRAARAVVMPPLVTR